MRGRLSVQFHHARDIRAHGFNAGIRDGRGLRRAWRRDTQQIGTHALKVVQFQTGRRRGCIDYLLPQMRRIVHITRIDHISAPLPARGYSVPVTEPRI